MKFIAGGHEFVLLADKKAWERWCKREQFTWGASEPDSFPCLGYSYAGYDEEAHDGYVYLKDVQKMHKELVKALNKANRQAAQAKVVEAINTRDLGKLVDAHAKKVGARRLHPHEIKRLNSLSIADARAAVEGGKRLGLAADLVEMYLKSREI